MPTGVVNHSKVLATKVGKQNLQGWYKRAPIVALRQAKFNPTWQAAVPQRLVYCGTTVDEPQ